MPYKTTIVDNAQELDDTLNGAVISTKHLKGRTFGLNGLTLIVQDGTSDRTVTFVDANNAGLTPKQIITAIHAVTNLVSPNVVLRNYGHNTPARNQIAIVTQTYIVRQGGTANTILGFSTSADKTVTEKVQANLVSVFKSDEGNRFNIVEKLP